MKVSELIELLEKIEDKGKDVIIAIQQYNKNYPVAYTEPWTLGEHLTQVGDVVRINTSLPDNMRTREIKGI